MACSRRVSWFLDAPAGLEASSIRAARQSDRDDCRANERGQVARVCQTRQMGVTPVGIKTACPRLADPTTTAGSTAATTAWRRSTVQVSHAARSAASVAGTSSRMPVREIGEAEYGNRNTKPDDPTDGRQVPAAQRPLSSTLMIARLAAWPSITAREQLKAQPSVVQSVAMRR